MMHSFAHFLIESFIMNSSKDIHTFSTLISLLFTNPGLNFSCHPGKWGFKSM